MPAYSPELNDIEPVFGAIKHHDLPERTYTSVDALMESIDTVFERAEERLLSKTEHIIRPAA